MKHRWLIAALFTLAGCARFQPLPIAPTENAASFDARSLANPQFRAFLETNLDRHFDQWPLNSWDLEKLTLAAFYYQPSLEVARAQWQVALGGDKTAAQRPNPTISAVPGYDFSATSGLSPWIPAVNFDLPIETAGKRGYRRAQAQHLSEAARLNLAVTAWQVRADLRASLIDLAVTHEREALLQKQNSLQERIGHSLEQQLEAGAISRFELTQNQIALAKGRLDLAEAKRQGMDAIGHVADAIGIPVKALDGLDVGGDVLRMEVPYGLALLPSDARRLALRSRADVLAALAEYAASQSALQLEIAKQYPDVHLGPGYQFDQGDDKFTFAVTVELPVLNQNQGPIAEALGRRAEAAARFNALQAKIIGDIDRAVAACRITSDNAEALESLATAQKKQGDAIEAQVKAGAAAQPDLLNAQLELAAGELAQLDAQARRLQAFAALEDAMQQPVDAWKPSLFEQPPMVKKDKP